MGVFERRGRYGGIFGGEEAGTSIVVIIQF